MSKIHAAITAVHGYAPDYVLTNQELETMVKKYPEQWFNYYDFWEIPEEK